MDIEAKILELLASAESVSTLELASSLGVDHQDVVGASKSLEADGYVVSSVTSVSQWKFSAEGLDIRQNGSPEFLLWALLASGSKQQDEVVTALGKEAATVAMSNGMKQKLFKLTKEDEADSSRSSAVLRNLFYLVKRCPFWFSMICIANSRWLNYFPADDQHASAHVQVVTFDAYNADVLRKIGEIAAAEVHQERRAKRHRENESSTTAEDDGKDDGAGAMLLAPAAAAFAAKTAVLNFGGDARKVKELVRRAADHHTNTTTSSITATRTVVAVAPPETSAAAKPVRGRPSKKLRDEVSNPSTTTNTATSCSVSTTLSLKDVMTAATSTSRVPASSVVERLPEHATYVLCCIVVMARRNALAAHMHRSSAVAPGLSEQQQQQRAIDSTSTVVFGASGEMRRLDVERCYKRLMAELRLPQCNQGVVTFALELLQLNGLISDTKTFVCSGEWTLAELETALVAKGTELLSDQDPGTSSQATNKFAEVFYRQRVLF